MDIDKMKKYFFSKSQQNNLRLIEILKDHNSSYKTLATDLGFSQSALKKRINHLMTDLLQILYLEKDDMNSLTDLVAIKMMIKKNTSVISELEKKYLKESSVFKVLLFILENREFSIDQASQRLLYSKSYMYKIINKLGMFLFKLEFGFNLEKQGKGKFKVVGEEQEIRIFNYKILSYACYCNINKPINHVSQKSILFIQSNIISEKLSPLGIEKFKIILEIYENSIRQGFYLPKIEDEILDLLRPFDMYKIKDKYSNNIEIGKNKTSTLVNEIKHLLLVISYLVPNFRSEQEKESIGKKISRMKQNNNVILCIAIVKKIEKRFSLSFKNYNKILYNLIINLVTIEYFGLHAFNEKKSQNDNNSYKVLFQHVSDIVEENLASKNNWSFYDEIKNEFINIVLGYLISETTQVMKVYIEFFNNRNDRILVENMLSRCFSPGVIEVTDDFSKASVVISDVFNKNSTNYFYFDDVRNHNSWKKLNLFLFEKIEQNITAILKNDFS